MSSHRGRKPYEPLEDTAAKEHTGAFADAVSIRDAPVFDAFEQVIEANRRKSEMPFRFKGPDTPCGWSTQWRPMLECTCGNEWTQAIGADAVCQSCGREGVQAYNGTGGPCFEKLGKCEYGCTMACKPSKPSATPTKGKDVTPVEVRMAIALGKTASAVTLNIPVVLTCRLCGGLPCHCYQDAMARQKAMLDALPKTKPVYPTPSLLPAYPAICLLPWYFLVYQGEPAADVPMARYRDMPTTSPVRSLA